MRLLIFRGIEFLRIRCYIDNNQENFCEHFNYFTYYNWVFALISHIWQAIFWFINNNEPNQKMQIWKQTKNQITICMHSAYWSTVSTKTQFNSFHLNRIHTTLCLKINDDDHIFSVNTPNCVAYMSLFFFFRLLHTSFDIEWID